MRFRWLGPQLPRDNNFDVIRLFAAAQVMVVHSSAHLRGEIPDPWAGVISAFPGVPIFFFISGLLVTSSLAGRDLGQYARARARRVLPALWLAFAMAIVLLAYFGQITRVELTDPTLWLWSFTQVTVFQVFNPDFFRDFGVGVVNGSLWTIPVEIGFYCILPVLVLVASQAADKKYALSLVLVLAAVISFMIDIGTRSAAGGGLFLEKLIQFSPAAHFWQFALGALAYVHFDRAMKAANRLNEMPLGWLGPITLYLAFALLAEPFLPKTVAQIVGALLLYAGVFTLGFAAPTIVGILRGADISYGLYLFHMLAVNALVEIGWRGWRAVLPAMAVSVMLAWLSWTFLESRVLHRRPPGPHSTTPAEVAP